MTKIQLVEEARKFGSVYLGEVSFNVLKDVKSWKNFLRKNGLDCELGVIHRGNGDHNDGWYLISFQN